MVPAAGFDRATWSVFAEQLGLCGLGVSERLGGSGGDFLDVAVVAEQFGASLACLPFLSSVVLAQAALAGSGDDTGECDLSHHRGQADRHGSDGAYRNP